MKISMLGAGGKMGKLILELAILAGEEIAHKIDLEDSIEDGFQDTDVLIDFSTPAATQEMLTLSLANQSKLPIVVGTTGLSKEHMDLMLRCAEYAPVFCSPNMSILVAMMDVFVGVAARSLPDEFDVEIVDIHHKMKKDAPSGTALMLGKTIAAARGDAFDDVAIFSRFAQTEQRKPKEIAFSVQRCGNISGVHEVCFVGSNEALSIKQEAFSRQCFAQGALSIARWLVEKPSGFFDMRHFAKAQIMKNF